MTDMSWTKSDFSLSLLKEAISGLKGPIFVYQASSISKQCGTGGREVRSGVGAEPYSPNRRRLTFNHLPLYKYQLQLESRAFLQLCTIRSILGDWGGDNRINHYRPAMNDEISSAASSSLPSMACLAPSTTRASPKDPTAAANLPDSCTMSTPCGTY